MAKAKYTQGKDGYWQTKVWDGTYTDTGAKHRITVRSKKSSRDLENMVKEIERNVESRKYIRQIDLNVYEYAKKWLEVYKASSEANTQRMYNQIIDKYICELSDVKINDLNKLNILMLINAAAGKLRTQQLILLTMKQIVKSAMSDKLLPAELYYEIFDGISVKKSKNKKRTLTESEKKAVFEIDVPDMYRAFLYIIYGCGLRKGEALALTRFDFNFKNKTITVNKAIAQKDGKPYLKGTKNGKSRTVTIPQKTLHFLEQYCQSIGSTELFVSPSGGYFTDAQYTTMWSRILRAMRKIGVKPTGLTAHIFRHNFCSNLCYQIPRISIKMVAELMGDSDAVVMDVYNHILMEKENTSEAVNNAMNF